MVGRTKRKSSRREKKRLHEEHKALVRLRKKFGIITLEDAKQRAIRKAVDAVKGDKTLAAALLGIGKTTIYRKVSSARGTTAHPEVSRSRKH